MLSFYQNHEKMIFIGNVLFIACCGFYLAWWVLAFRPSGAVTGIRTGWILIPAVFAGLSGVISIIWGILENRPASLLFPGGYILCGGIAAFLILLAVTVILLKRPATSELFLIIGWGMLALAVINALFGSGLFSRHLSMGFILLTGISVVISLICYMLYYNLSSRTGYIVGMIPLLLVALNMAGISFCMVILNK